MGGYAELSDLAADIAEHGLVHAITVSADFSVLLDGRNRLKACELAAVEPRFERLAEGLDPVVFILSGNINRRHLSKGQRAMIVAEACKVTLQTTRVAAASAGTSHTYVAWAEAVLKYAPELAEQVRAGGSLQQAYEEAQRRKGLPALEAERKHRAKVAEEHLRASIQLLREQIGPEIPIREAPDLSITALDTKASPIPDPAPALNLDSLRHHQELLRDLTQAKLILDKVYRQPVEAVDWWPAGYVMGIRSAVSQIVDLAYAIADAHNAVAEAPRLVAVP